jgi:hypothetical protein
MLLVGTLFRLGVPAVGSMGMGMFLVQFLDLKQICYSLEDIFPSIRSSYEPLCPQNLDLWSGSNYVPTQPRRHGKGTGHGRAARAVAEFAEFREVW